MNIFAGRNFFPKHQAALIVPTDTETTPAQTSTGTPLSAQSVSPMLGTLSAGSQFTSTGGHLQSNALVSQNAYPTGRMTPQAMQQGIKIFALTACVKVRLRPNTLFFLSAIYQGNTAAGGMTTSNPTQTAAAVILQRQIQYQPTQQPSSPGNVLHITSLAAARHFNLHCCLICQRPEIHFQLNEYPAIRRSVNEKSRP